MTDFELWVPGTPLPQRRGGISTHYPKRKDGGGGGLRPFPIMFPHSPTEKEQRRLASYATHAMETTQGAELITGPVAIFVLLVFRIPKSWTRKHKEQTWWHIQPPDCSNCIKLIEDSMNGVVFADDRQVVASFSAKVWSDTREGYLIRVVPLEHSQDGFAAGIRKLVDGTADLCQQFSHETMERDVGRNLELPTVGG